MQPDLSSPAPSSVTLVPLGGLGEIGMNCMALIAGGRTLLIDCGTSFPEEDLGIDVLHPDFAWLEREAPPVAGLFLTHGHEDHIGAISFLLSRIKVPIWGPPHALALVERRLAERKAEEPEMHETEPGKVYSVGPFSVEPIRVTHSIVEATALKITASGLTVVHSGDFKFDATPPDGEPTDEDRLLEVGVEGVDLLLSDSTNVDRPGFTRSEAEVKDNLRELLLGAPDRVVVALFASNVQRLIALGELAQEASRKICLLGRSLLMHVDIATRLGYLKWPSNLLIGAERAQREPRRRLLVLSGGTQGEQGSSTERLSLGIHPYLRVEPGDRVIFSSRIIPGNDRRVLRMMTGFLRQGVELYSHLNQTGIHASGHAARGEQQKLIELLAPRCFVPIHGTLHHLTQHAALARSLGVQRVEVIENGQTLSLTRDGLTRGRPVPSGRIAVAFGGRVLPRSVLEARQESARAGVVSVALVLDYQGRSLVAPSLCSIGVPGLDEEPARAARIASQVADVVEENLSGWRAGRLNLDEQLTRAVRRAVEHHTGFRPLIRVHLSETAERHR